MKQLYSRAHEALLAVSRQDFVSGADLAPSITGHSIPREETVRHLLGLMPEIDSHQVVMHVGGGSGYLTAVLARLAPGDLRRQEPGAGGKGPGTILPVQPA